MDFSDPMVFKEVCWPDITFYKEQRDIIYSVVENDETFVPAGNELGKDFVAGFVALWFFCSRRPARVVTTSVQQTQLEDVLWGEIKRFIDTSKIKLPILQNHMHIRQLRNDGSIVPMCEIRGQVTRQGEALLGRHIERGPGGLPTTLAIFDEASGIMDSTYNSSSTWAHRKLIIGNPFPCTNFFRKGVREGDLKAPTNSHYWRKVIKIKATDSPNVRLAFAQKESGKEPTKEELIPGVLTYGDYLKRRVVWDEMMQCIGLDAEFYEGYDVLLCPPDWLELAEKRPRARAAGKMTLGVDSAEGNDNTCWVVCSMQGLVHMISLKTPDTSQIVPRTLGLMNQFNIRPHDVLFDRGGGGKEHADRLRSQGHHVRTIAFGGAASPEKRRGHRTVDMRIKDTEISYTYKNRRAEMYGAIRTVLNPHTEHSFSLPSQIIHKKREDKGPSLYEQLRVMPLLYDPEGRMYLPPKRKKDQKDQTETLTDMVGCSPDEADALALAIFGLIGKPPRRTGGAIR